MTKVLTLYGLASCDTCRQARKWLDNKEIEYTFHDVRKDGLEAELLQRWSKRLGWEKLINKQSLTWRKVPQADRDNMNKNSAILTLVENPTLLKRPVLESSKLLAIGFTEASYKEIFAKS